MKKEIFVALSIICILCVCKSAEDAQEETVIIQESSVAEEQQTAEYYNYETYNNKSLNISSVDLFNHITEHDIYIYSEEVKGTYKPVISGGEIFPINLIVMLEDSLYNSSNLGTRNVMEEIIDSHYFRVIQELGADIYVLNLEEIYQLFPEVSEHKDEIDNIYQAYQFINRPKDCNGIFYLNEAELYVFVYESGGSNGANSVLITKREKEEFVYLCEFETQNNGYGRVIKYENSFYYVFLEYNYNLKIYDGIKIHKIGINADLENISIKYLPKKFVWKNIFGKQIIPSSDINEYIEGIEISFDEYMESGGDKAIQIFWGDETEDSDFPLADDFNQYHKIDFTNTRVPIYIRKSVFEPSDYRSTWHLRAKFYGYDTKTSTAVELENLEIGEQLPVKNELVQLWFKEINSKVFTFTLHHISNYNYMFNVLLIEGREIKVIRTDIISPQRQFILTEGEVFKLY